MKKNNIDKLMTADMWRISISQLLMSFGVYMMLPIMPILYSQMGAPFLLSLASFPLFWLGGIFLGPFHAYLEDAYSRKGLLKFSLLGMIALAVLGHYTSSYIHSHVSSLTFAAIAVVIFIGGVLWGLFTSSMITISIDTSASKVRSKANRCLFVMSRIGIISGLFSGCFLFAYSRYVLLISAVISFLLISRVYVAFRAPLGLPKCSCDRFFLTRTWLPAINIVLMGVGVCILIPWLYIHFAEVALDQYIWMVAWLLVFGVITVFSLNMFLKLASHCQRSTSNFTLYLSVETSVLAGLGIGYYLVDKGFELEYLSTISITVFTISLLLFLLLTKPYFRKKRVR